MSQELTRDERDEQIYLRSQERADSLLERLNARIQETLAELHEGALEDEFNGFTEKLTPAERAAWEEAWWAKRRKLGGH